MLPITFGLLSLAVQIGAAQVTGLIADRSGAPLPGATVTLTNIATRARRVAVTTGDGVYAAVGLTPGPYRMEVSLSGFSALTRHGLQLATGQTLRLDVTLAVGPVNEQVTVTGAA